MNVNMPTVGLVALLSSLILYWRVTPQLLPAVLTVQGALLKATLNRGERLQKLALAFVSSPFSSWVHKLVYPRYWMASKLYILRTSEQTRQTRAFVSAFDGSDPEPVDELTQRLVTSQLILLAASIEEEDRKLQIIVELEQQYGKSAAQIAAPIRMQMHLAQVKFDYARSAAAFFGYDLAETWQQYVEQIDDFLASATG